MSDPVALAKEVSGWSDRALFLFVLILGGIGVVWIVRYLVTRDEKKTEQFQGQLQGLYREAANQSQEVTRALQANTDVIRENGQLFRENTEFLRRAQEG